MTAVSATQSGADLPASLVALMSVGAGLAVAALYYSQPMLALLGASLGASPRAIGWVPALTQLGYALGIFLLAPLGDRHDRRRIILAKAAVLTLALVGAGAATTWPELLLASALIGLTATLAQDLVPAAAALAPEHRRGKIVGTVMTGLLLGILLSRVVSGFVAEQWGWRVMYSTAAASIALFAWAAARTLPHFVPTTHLPYRALLASLAQLWRRHPSLRRATLAQGLLSLAFSAFWSTLAVMLHDAPFHVGSTVAGLFGVAGAAGALAAPLAGRMADRRGPEGVTRLGAALVTVSFLGMTAASLTAPLVQLWLIGVCAVGFDLGVQTSLIAHQTLVYGIDPGARSRLNAVLLTGMFIGMAAGAALGSLALARFGWAGVTLLASSMGAAALWVRWGQPGARRGA